jgi:hypothetical protein
MNKWSNKLRVLVACKYSGRVRDAFRALGHDALSCDLLPTDAPGPHYQGDVKDVLGQEWDVLIAFPPCTYLCSSGMHRTVRGLRDPKLTEDALAFVRMFLNAPVRYIALENPVGCISTRIREPDCIIQPWQFGHPESKTTCLWLKNLPALEPTEVCEKPPSGRWTNQTPSGQNKLGPSAPSLEGTEQDLPWNRERDGKAVERVRVVFAGELPECDCCGEPWCAIHARHYAECSCVGPSNAEDEGYKLEEDADGALWAVK